LEVLSVAAHFPVDQALQVVEHHVLVGVDFLVRGNNADADTSGVDGLLVRGSLLAEQIEVILEVVGRTLDVVLFALLVEQKTETERGLSLGRASRALVGNAKHLAEVLDSLGRVAVLAFDL